MTTELASAELRTPRKRPLGFELVFVVLVSLAVLVPGVWSYSLVDPWETHYGEVARMMLQNHDWVHTEWPQDGEGFRSKPVLSFWLMAAGMRAVGVAADGGFSGEMVHDARIMLGIRLPFIACAVCGLTLLWWMLARLVSRRLAWLALLVVGSCPMFCLIARQAIPDTPLVACVIGALSLFTMAVEDGDRPIVPLGRLRLGRRTVLWDARHVVLGIAGAIVAVQAIYYAIYFILAPQLAVRSILPSPALYLPAMMALLVGALHCDGWKILRLPCLLFGGIVAAIVNAPMRRRAPDQTLWRHIFDDVLASWEPFSLDRYLLRGAVFAFVPELVLTAAGMVLQLFYPRAVLPIVVTFGVTAAIWVWFTLSGPWAWPLPNWRRSGELADRVLAMVRITTMRQVYLLGCYCLLGISVLAKGPPGLAVVGAVGVFHVILRNQWRALLDGAFEIKRGILLMVAVFLPWHLAMYLKDGVRFLDEYLFTHIFNRATVGVDNSPGTFEYYSSQIGHGMWLWAALVPAALGAAVLRARHDTREGRVRFMVALWAIGAVGFFCLVQTKFHHYILPAIPALGVLVAFLLDDLAARRTRLHPLYALVGVAIALLVCRDLSFEPERWIEMFVFRYDRPWPTAEPWQIDPSDGVLGLGVAAAVALGIAAVSRRLGVIALGGAGLAIAVWALQIYMPIAGTHWGMRDAIRTYYDERTVYGVKLVYFGPAGLADDWRDVGDRWTFDTHIPTTMHVGQPMTIKIQLNKADDERLMEQELVLIGRASAIGDHTVEITLAPGERARLDPLVARGKTGGRGRRPTVRVVDADRLIAWQLYWRGENFWSGDEIWGYLPEMKTAFVKTDNVEFTKYINDRTRTPLGRRYFLITEGGRINSVRAQLPTQRARDSYEVLDTTSNKFSLAAFWM